MHKYTHTYIHTYITYIHNPVKLVRKSVLTNRRPGPTLAPERRATRIKFSAWGAFQCIWLVSRGSCRMYVVASRRSCWMYVVASSRSCRMYVVALRWGAVQYMFWLRVVNKYLVIVSVCVSVKSEYLYEIQRLIQSSKESKHNSFFRSWWRSWGNSQPRTQTGLGSGVWLVE